MALPQVAGAPQAGSKYWSKEDQQAYARGHQNAIEAVDKTRLEREASAVKQAHLKSAMANAAKAQEFAESSERKAELAAKLKKDGQAKVANGTAQVANGTAQVDKGTAQVANGTEKVNERARQIAQLKASLK